MESKGSSSITVLLSHDVADSSKGLNLICDLDSYAFTVMNGT
jgi:hypothetical protein